MNSWACRLRPWRTRFFRALAASSPCWVSLSEDLDPKARDLKTWDLKTWDLKTWDPKTWDPKTLGAEEWALKTGARWRRQSRLLRSAVRKVPRRPDGFLSLVGARHYPGMGSLAHGSHRAPLRDGNGAARRTRCAIRPKKPSVGG